MMRAALDLRRRVLLHQRPRRIPRPVLATRAWSRSISTSRTTEDGNSNEEPGELIRFALFLRLYIAAFIALHSGEVILYTTVLGRVPNPTRCHARAPAPGGKRMVWAQHRNSGFPLAAVYLHDVWIRPENVLFATLSDPYYALRGQPVRAEIT